MSGLGFPELIVVLIIIFVIFGAGKLPAIGEAIGKGINNFKKAYKKPDSIDMTSSKYNKTNSKSSQ
jgi:sec-independent protein translocase protein TatA